jgi:SH3 domain-containing protein
MRNTIVLTMLGLLSLFSLKVVGQEAAKPSITLMYSGPENMKDVNVMSFQFREYKPGEKLFVASHNSNLRKKPSSKSKVVTTLTMAARVKVIKPVGVATTIIGKVDKWYQIEVIEPGPNKGKKGFLFGMLLTPAAFHVDLDGDGEKEIVTVAFAQNFKIRVRIREPKVDEPDHVSFDVDSAGGAYLSQQGGLADISLVPKEKAGIGLVQVYAHVEACADFATRWVSYTVPGNKPGVLGEPKLAMTQSGLADSPVHSDYKVSWDPKAKTATAVQTTSEEDENGKEHVEKKTRRYKLVEGIFKEVK